MWQVFEAPTADGLWGTVLEQLRVNAEVRRQESRVGPTRELLHVALTLRQPRERWIYSRMPALNPAFALAEIVWIMAGRRDARFLTFFNHSLQRHAGNATEFHGAYGYRLRRHAGVDQLEKAFESLRSNPNSRQVVLHIWDARDDLPLELGMPRDPDVPCNTHSYLKLRNGRLEWMQSLRSNDVFLGLPHNLIQFTALQEIMAGWLGAEVGEYHHVTDSLHLYERDLAIAGIAPCSAPFQVESLSLAKPESDRVFAELTQDVEAIIDESNGIEALETRVRRSGLPRAYLSVLRVLTAEGVRRRGAVHRAGAIMEGCTNRGFQHLWSRWIERISSKHA